MVSLDLKIYFINILNSYRMKNILHLNFCCIVLMQVSAIDMFHCTMSAKS